MSGCFSNLSKRANERICATTFLGGMESLFWATLKKKFWGGVPYSVFVFGGELYTGDCGLKVVTETDGYRQVGIEIIGKTYNNVT